MTGVYYNEHEPYAAQWLRNLMAAGHIPEGDVDERDIQGVSPTDVLGYRQCHWFAGIGGWALALRLAGWPDDRAVWTGSCPCQPFSAAGAQAGGDDPRHLWPAWARLIAECRPDVIFGEQVESAIAHGWLDLACDDLETMGYAVGPVCLPARSVGAEHVRQRLWFVADAHENSMRAPRQTSDQSTPTELHQRGTVKAGRLGGWWANQPEPRSVVYGLSGVVDSLRPFGNAIVPQVGAAFVGAYLDTLEHTPLIVGR